MFVSPSGISVVKSHCDKVGRPTSWEPMPSSSWSTPRIVHACIWSNTNWTNCCTTWSEREGTDKASGWDHRRKGCGKPVSATQHAQFSLCDGRRVCFIVVTQDLSNAVLLVFANKQDLRINGDPRASGSSAAAGSSSSASAAAAPAASSSSSSSSSSSISAASAAAADAAAASFSSCLTAAEIADYLNLQAIKDHSWHIQACCALTGEGLYEGIEWVTQAVTKA